MRASSRRRVDVLQPRPGSAGSAASVAAAPVPRCALELAAACAAPCRGRSATSPAGRARRVGRQRAVQQGVPAAEAHLREVGQHGVVLHDGACPGRAGGPAGRRPGGLAASRASRCAAGHRRGGPQEVVVVRHVADAVGALRVDLRQIAPVGLDRALVGPDRRLRSGRRACRCAPACAAGGPSRAPRSRRKSALGWARCGWARGFLQVDPVVVRAGKAGSQRQRAEQRVDLGRPGLGAAVRRPPVVGVQVEQRLGRQQRDVGIAGVALRQRAHALARRRPRRRPPLAGGAAASASIRRAARRGALAAWARPRVSRARRARRQPAPCRH